MDPAAKIAALETKREQLEQLLTLPERVPGEWVAIRQQIAAIDGRITKLYDLLPRPAAAPPQHSRFVCRAIIPNCKKANGIRSLMFYTAQQHGARFVNVDDPQTSIVYSGDDLQITVAFATEAKAVDFRSAVLSLSKPPASLPGVSAKICEDHATDSGAYIEEGHYVPADSDSPFNSLKCLQGLPSQSSVTVLSRTDELAKYQMLENPLNPMHAEFRPERAHIVPKSSRGSDSPDNCLALYRVPMHQLFDGIETASFVPGVKLLPGAVGEKDSLTGRTEVKVIVKCRTRSVYDMLIPYMQVGALCNPGDWTITCTVHVNDPSVFASNLRKRARDVDKKWEDSKADGEESDSTPRTPVES